MTTRAQGFARAQTEKDRKRKEKSIYLFHRG